MLVVGRSARRAAGVPEVDLVAADGRLGKIWMPLEPFQGLQQLLRLREHSVNSFDC